MDIICRCWDIIHFLRDIIVDSPVKQFSVLLIPEEVYGDDDLGEILFNI